ncbi:MAG: hypothetical protein ABR596_07275, partial [Halarsenatibacteraceae bacterium]
MIKEDFKLTIQGLKTNEKGGILIDMKTDYDFNRGEAMVIANAVLTSTINSFDYSPVELMFHLMSEYY